MEYGLQSQYPTEDINHFDDCPKCGNPESIADFLEWVLDRRNIEFTVGRGSRACIIKPIDPFPDGEVKSKCHRCGETRIIMCLFTAGIKNMTTDKLHRYWNYAPQGKPCLI